MHDAYILKYRGALHSRSRMIFITVSGVMADPMHCLQDTVNHNTVAQCQPNGKYVHLTVTRRLSDTSCLFGILTFTKNTVVLFDIV